MRKRYYCNELPSIIYINRGVTLEMFTGAWVNVHTLDTEGYTKVTDGTITPAGKVKVDKYFKDLETTNIRDLPFIGEAEVTLHDWNSHNLILEYLGNYYKISNFTESRGVMMVKLRRTPRKGYLRVLNKKGQ